MAEVVIVMVIIFAVSFSLIIHRFIYGPVACLGGRRGSSQILPEN